MGERRRSADERRPLGKGATMRRVLLVALLSLVLVATSVGVAVGITNGQPDGDGHPYVGLLVFDSAPAHPVGGAADRWFPPPWSSPLGIAPMGRCGPGVVRRGRDLRQRALPAVPLWRPGSGAVKARPTPTRTTAALRTLRGGNGLPAFSYRDTVWSCSMCPSTWTSTPNCPPRAWSTR